LSKSSDIVIYSFVNDLKGEILVHSNPKNFPLGMRLDDEITIKTLGIRDIFIQPVGNSYDLSFPVFYNNIPKGIVRIGISKKIMQEKINKSIFDLVLFNLLFSLIGIFGAIIFSRTISKPLHQLSETAEAISKGELEHDLYSNRKDEIGRLINNFHAMAINVKKAKEDLEKLSTMDEITGVYNHRFFYRMLQSEFEKSKRYNYVIACIMFDVDHFKSINDTYGHQFGDYVLRKLGSLTTSVLRSTDIISRYGGDEFLILLPHSDKNSALIFAEKIRKKIESFTFSSDGHSINTTISIGVSTFPDVDTDVPEDLIKNADLSLYKSKWNKRI
jgi:diguanylate cyclase (GGDEF)-like protein